MSSIGSFLDIRCNNSMPEFDNRSHWPFHGLLFTSMGMSSGLIAFSASSSTSFFFFYTTRTPIIPSYFYLQYQFSTLFTPSSLCCSWSTSYIPHNLHRPSLSSQWRLPLLASTPVLPPSGMELSINPWTLASANTFSASFVTRCMVQKLCSHAISNPTPLVPKSSLRSPTPAAGTKQILPPIHRANKIPGTLR